MKFLQQSNFLNTYNYLCHMFNNDLIFEHMLQNEKAKWESYVTFTGFLNSTWSGLHLMP